MTLFKSNILIQLCKFFRLSLMFVTAVFFSTLCHAAVTPVVGLWGIDAENNGSSGRGMQIDVQSGTMVLTVYAYNPDGSPQFYLSAGSLVNGVFTGLLNTYAGGTSFGHQYQPAYSTGNAGKVTVTFSDSKHGLITFPGETPKAISYFALSGADTTTVASTCNTSNFTIAAYQSISLGMSLSQVEKIMGCHYTEYNPPTAMFPNTSLYSWIGNSLELRVVSVFFDGSGTLVAYADTTNAFKYAAGF